LPNHLTNFYNVAGFWFACPDYTKVLFFGLF